MRKDYGLIIKASLINTVVVLVLMVLVHNFIGVRFSGTPVWDDLSVRNNYRFVDAEDGRNWRVIYQYPWDSTFTGDVRHVSLWEDDAVPMMTHDIVVTYGQFSDPAIVRTQVVEERHSVIYRYFGRRPAGDINLLHVFPASEEVLADVEQIRDGDVVRIRGREILLVNFYNARGDGSGHLWDEGCRTILVTSVEILPRQVGGR